MLAGTGEPHVLISRDLLEAACSRPYHHWAFGGIEDVVALSVILLFAIAENHPFIQGNKRTAFAAMVFFLEHNGFQLTSPDDPALADTLIAVLEKRTPREAFEESLRRVVASSDKRPWG
ncbi:MAG: type II toxin-antitoxin system death-on-curing family toxin [Caulobacteraceae bacterium]|nr:type II toxin-antitoxin system death-on-curing family toxin [Caulobacteraceae bacterium]